MSTPGLIHLVVFLLYAGFLLRQGFGRRRRFASWRMFARLARCRFDLIDARDGTPFNPWRYLPHTAISMSRDNLELFMLFLRMIHDLDRLEGHVHVREGLSETTLRVRDSDVVG